MSDNPRVVRAFLCNPTPRNCWACDSSVPHGIPEMMITTRGVYCSIDCHDDWTAYLDEQEAKRRPCAECGYDLQEHDPRSCSHATEKDRLREGVPE